MGSTVEVARRLWSSVVVAGLAYGSDMVAKSSCETHFERGEGAVCGGFHGCSKVARESPI